MYLKRRTFAVGRSDPRPLVLGAAAPTVEAASNLPNLPTADAVRFAVDRAQAALRNHCPDATFPVNVVEVARGMGLEVYTATLDEGTVLSALTEEPGEPTRICISRRVPLVTQRFSVARELGHYVLGPDGALDVFAVELLMPAYAVRECHTLGLSPYDMGQFFCVSPLAAMRRLAALHARPHPSRG